MKISELARRGGVSVSTVKYYLRAGLLPPGARTARNQARYGDRHLRRLRLVRALLEIGGLSVRATQELLAATDHPDAPGPDLLAALHLAPTGRRSRALTGRVSGRRWRELAAMVARFGSRTSSHDRALGQLAEICVAARLLEVPEVCAALEAYADAAARLADCDLLMTRRLVERLVRPGQPRPIPEAVTAAMVLGHAAAALLHGVARETKLASLFDGSSEA